MNIKKLNKEEIFCCTTLAEAKSKAKRYFSRINIVYVPKIRTFVLTNKRRYVYAPEIDTYMLEQSLKYKILNFCPFCGKDISKYRIQANNEKILIVDAIKKWRETPTSPYAKTKLEFNCYDCFWSIACILADEYINFNSNTGVDYLGNVYKGAKFLTVDKIFRLITKCDVYYCYDGERKDFVNYYVDNFSKHAELPEEDKLELKCLINNFLWLVFHNEKNLYNELIEMEW